MIEGPIETRLAVSEVLADIVGVEVHFNPLNKKILTGKLYGAA